MKGSLYDSFHHFLHYYQVSRLACGVIVASCANLSREALEELQAFMGKEEPKAAAQFCYDQDKGILGILLDDQKIGYTHFYSLYVKDFLEKKKFYPVKYWWPVSRKAQSRPGKCWPP